MKSRPPMFIGLLHGPILNKRGEEITTSVTNLDIHDIARSARTFGFDGYFIITPIEAQHGLLGRILGHWDRDEQSAYNPDRKDALQFVQLSKSLDQTISQVTEMTGEKPLLAVTGANFAEDDGDENSLVQRILIDNKPLILLFGTGWGLPASIIERADFRLNPILGNAKDGYNHLSVRSAVAIYCDRVTRSL